MRRTCCLLLGLILSATLVTVLVTAPSPPSGATARPSASPASVIDDFVARQARSSGPGVEVAVTRHGKPVHVAAAGDDGRGHDVRTDTPMRVESLSKSFTATAVMQLVEAGRVRLDAPGRGYLPELRIDDPRASRITVRQLLTHTSGITDATSPDLYGGDVTTLRQAVRRLDGATLASAPGATFSYCNANYHVLARLVEKVSGERFADYLRDRVFGPAGMDDTRDVSTANQAVPGIARGHLTAYGRTVASDGPDYFVEGSGGVVTTAEDMSRWLALQSSGGRAADGTQVVSASSVRLMHRPQSPDGSDYGFGWYHAESAEGPPVRTSHSGAGGGFVAYQGLFPDSGYGVAVLINHGAGLTAADAGVVGQNLLAELDPSIPPLEERGSGLWIDLVLTLVTLLVLAWAVLSVRRARRWADRRQHHWVVPLWLAPQLLWIALVLRIPSLQLYLTQRTAPWRLLFTVEPVAVVMLWVVGLGCAVVLATRVVALLRRPGARVRDEEHATVAVSGAV